MENLDSLVLRVAEDPGYINFLMTTQETIPTHEVMKDDEGEQEGFLTGISAV